MKSYKKRCYIQSNVTYLTQDYTVEFNSWDDFLYLIRVVSPEYATLNTFNPLISIFIPLKLNILV